MTIKRLAVAAAIALTGFVLLPGTASAHHPEISATPSRPCGEDAPWSATFTAHSDQDWDLDWQSRHRIDNGGWSD